MTVSKASDKKNKNMRQDSYQQAIESSNLNSVIVNIEDKPKASAIKQEPQLGEKLTKFVVKKQSKSPRRRAEAYQRPKSSSSDEENRVNQPKRTHRSKATKKSFEKS